MSELTCPPHLREFLAAWFHQDWPLEATRWEEVVQGFAASEHPSVVEHVARDAIELAISDVGDDELASLLIDECGSFYVPTAEHLSAREWLVALAAELRRMDGDPRP